MTDTFYSATRVGDTWTDTGMSSGDTIPNCLGEFREIRENKQRTGIALYGHPAGTPGAAGVERLRPRGSGPGLGGGEGGGQRIGFSARIESIMDWSPRSRTSNPRSRSP